MNWPPDYTKELLLRQERLLRIIADPLAQAGAREHYKNNPIDYIEHWCITYDPRNASQSLPTTMPFILFPKQKEMVAFIMDCLRSRENGLLEKCRDMGATWLCVALTTYLWLFWDGASVGWGSRKEQLVDKIGDPDSIFEKIRRQIDATPPFLLPVGFNPQAHLSYMKCINPENGATITGESGDNIGRGGRKLIYFKDESAHYERPEKIEAALGDNTDVQIDISSVNGTANIFARRRQSGVVWEEGKEMPKGATRVLVLDWRDHPAKSQEWYDGRRAKAEREGLLHIFAQEVDRDYSAAVEGVLIPAPWIKAAVDLHKKLDGGMKEGKTYAGLDVADEGGDLNSLATRKGITLFDLDKWAQGDTGVTANKAVQRCKMNAAEELHYDCIGVGAGVKAETNRLKREGLVGKRLLIIPWNAAASVMNPEEHIIKGDKQSPKNKDMFQNLSAQAAWSLRSRFEKTFKAVHQAISYPVEELINIESTTPFLHELTMELSQPTYSHNGAGKIVLNKKPDGTKSPNLFDGVKQAFFPYKEQVLRAGVW
jgi:hypothetical protein